MNHRENTLFCNLYDIIGGRNSTEKQRQKAWQELLLIEDNLGFSILIAAEYSWRTIPNQYKEMAWQELLKRDVKNDKECLHYLSVNAPEPWKNKTSKK